MSRRIDLTPENVRMARALAEASSEPDGWGPFKAEGDASLDALMTRTGESCEVFSVYVKSPGGELFTAITGNGPQSEANAAFYVDARALVLSLLDDREERLAEVERLRAAILGADEWAGTDGVGSDICVFCGAERGYGDEPRPHNPDCIRAELAGKGGGT